MGDLSRVAPVLRRAGDRARRFDELDDAVELGRLSAACAAVLEHGRLATDDGRSVADDGVLLVEPVTLGEWAAEHDIPQRTARRHAANGTIRAAMIRGRWYVEASSDPSHASGPAAT